MEGDFDFWLIMFTIFDCLNRKILKIKNQQASHNWFLFDFFAGMS